MKNAKVQNKKHYLCKNINFFRDMKRIALITFLILNGLWSIAQTQQGVVKTLGRPEKKGEALQGVTIRVKGQHNPVVSNHDGTFSLFMSGKKNGDPFSLQQVQKNGYELNETSLIGRQQAFSDKVPLTIVMVSSEQLRADKERIEAKAQEVASNNYEKKRAVLEQQLADNILSNKQYQEAIFVLQNKFENYQSLIEGLAEHYAHTDYDQLDEKEREINICIENGALDKADSLLRMLFDPIADLRRNKEALDDLNKQIEQAQGVITQANTDMAAILKQQEKDAEYLYQLYTIALARFDNEKAGFYIETRAELDTFRGDWQHDAAYYFFKQNQFTKAEPFFARALEFYRTAAEMFPEDYDYELAEVLNDYALLYDLTQRLSESEDLFFEALKIYRRLGKNDTETYAPIIANVLNNLGNLYEKASLYSNSKDAYLEAAEIYYALPDDIYTQHKDDVALVLGNLANVYSNTTYLSQAEELYNSVIDMYGELVEEKSKDYEIDLARNQFNLAALYYEQQRYEESEALFLKSIEIYEKKAAENPQAYEPDLAVIYKSLATLYTATEETTKSEAMFNNSIDLYLRLVEVDSVAYEPDVADLLYSQAIYLYNSDEISESEDSFYDVIAIYEHLAEDYPKTYEPKIADVYQHLATLYDETQRPTECEASYQEALDIYWRSINDNPEAYDIPLANTIDALDEFYKKHQRHADREVLFQDALQRYVELAGTHPEFAIRVAGMHAQLGVVLLKENKYPEAISSFKEALPYYRKWGENDSYYRNRLATVLYYLSMLYEETGDIPTCFQTNKELIPLMREGYDSDPDSFRKDYVSTLGNQSYNAILMKDFAEAEKQAKDALAIDPSQHWIVTNLAAALLFQGKYNEAEKFYLNYKDELKDNFLNDFNDFEADGIIPEEHRSEVERIKQILNE